MKRLLLSLAVLALTLGAVASAGEKKARVLLIGKDRDHAYSHHEYMPDCEILANCLRQTPGVDAVVSNGWPKDPAILKDVTAIVLNTRKGGNVLFDPLVKGQADELLKRGVGLTAIHWGTGADEKPGRPWLQAMGGWFSAELFSRYFVHTTKLKQADSSHPICRGWKDFDLRDEYYIELVFLPKAKHILTANVQNQDHTIAWTYERPDGGRSFGFVGGHFHDNFGIKEFRRAIVNGILWTANIEVPPDGAPVEITPKDMELPPDERKKK